MCPTRCSTGISTGNGTLEYIWQNDAGNTIDTNATVEVSNSGVYNLIITDISNNCTAQTNIEVAQDTNLPMPITSVDGIINCINQSVWLDGSQSTGSGTLEYIWQDDAFGDARHARLSTRFRGGQCSFAHFQAQGLILPFLNSNNS